jgi:PatG C-terminal
LGPAAQELFDRIIQIADNTGATDADRAVNYCALRYPAIYARAGESFAADSSLTGLEVRPSPLSGVRKVAEVVFSYTNRATDVTEKFFVRVDVTEEFPFLVTKLSPYYDR